MGHLLSSAIKMQSSALATATLTYEFVRIIYGTMTIYKNGSVLQTMTSTTSLQSVTINAGDTFYATFTGGFGTIDYFVNGSYTAGFSGNPATTSTYTASAGNTYYFFGSDSA